MKTQKHCKLNISLPAELHAWIVKRQKEEQAKTRFGTVPLSKIIADCVAKTMDDENANRASLNKDITPN